MSKELARIQGLVKECLLANAGVLEPNHATLVYNQILSAFKAHIEGCKMPENPHKDVFINRIRESIAERAFGDGVEADRKALMESLE